MGFDIKWLSSGAYLVRVANVIATLPAMQEKMDRVYSEDKYRFYNSARSNSGYTHMNMARGRLEFEVASKRNLGILAEALKDKNVYERIKPILMGIHPALKLYLDSRGANKLMEEVVLEETQKLCAGAARAEACLLISSYVLFVEWGDSCFDSLICALAAATMQQLSSMEEEIEDGLANDERKLADILQIFDLSPNDWKFIKATLNTDFVNKFKCAEHHEEAELEIDLQAIKPFADYLDEDEQKELMTGASSIINLMAQVGIYWDNVTLNHSISKTELKKILRACYALSYVKGGLRPHHYLYVYVIYILSKEIVSMREFYWKNNAETQFLETQRLLEENTSLKQQVDALQQQFTQQSDQYAKSAKTQHKQHKATIHQLSKEDKAEQSALRRKIEELEKKLLESEAQKTELYQLRDLVLNESAESKQGEKRTLPACLNNKKVVVVGGHVNWRNKLKQAYPDLDMFDGTSTVFDLRLLDNADLLVFYTYNMSHKIYERTITYARQKGIPTAYLPRVTNVELFELHLLQVLDNLL